MNPFKKPNEQNLIHFLEESKKLNFSYAEIGATQSKFPIGYDHDLNGIYLGNGAEVWGNAKNAIRNWEMFFGNWACLFPKETPIEKGETVVMCVRVFGTWWRNSCKIVYTFDEPNRFGFAYGTLMNHFEQGEEIFMVEKDEEGNVFYKIQAFSKPRFWLVKLGYPFARFFQKKFVRESKKHMKKICTPS